MSRVMIIITSAAIGGGIGYVVGNLLADKYANEDIVIIDNETEEETTDDDEEEQEDLLESDEENSVLVDEDDDQVVNYTQFYKGEDVDTLHALARRYKTGEDEEGNVPVQEESITEEVIHKHASAIEPVRDLSQPHIISKMQYEESTTGSLKAVLHYYEDDDILTDHTDDVVPNAERIVGSDALTSFGELSEDDDVVYVRNPILSGEYEIIRFKKSYSEEVLGIRPVVRSSRSVRTARKAALMHEES